MGTSGRGTALVVRHLAFEDLGTFAATLSHLGLDVEYCEVGVDPVDVEAVVAADLLVVLGGPIGVGDVAGYPYLQDELAAIRARLGTDRATLGICLGSQLIAAALGASVQPTGRVEIGYAPLELHGIERDDVLAPLAEVPVLHWHGDAFAIPDGAIRLASTPGFPNQAFSFRRALALQFHPEADPDRIEQWLIGHAHELAANRIDVDRLRSDAGRYGVALAQAGRTLLTGWLHRTGVLPDLE